MRTKLIFGLIIANTIASSIYSQQKKVEVTYIANAGFMIESNNKQLAIDALFNIGTNNSYYLNLEDSIATKIINCYEPFDKLHLMLITHNHRDHFKDSMVVKYLNHNSNNILIAPSLVTNAILSHPDYKKYPNQLVELDNINQDKNDTVIQGIRIKSFFIQHDFKPNVQNVGYLIEIGGIKIFHTGDYTGGETIKFENLQLQNENIDLALLNFYCFWESEEQREFTKSRINSKNVVLMHIPPKEIDAVKDFFSKKDGFSNITIFVHSMDKKSFSY